jgi:hypothetical protein
MTVVLMTSALAENTQFTITGTGVKDVTGNALSPDNIAFTSGKKFTFPSLPKVAGQLQYQRFEGTGSEAVIPGRLANGPPPEVESLLGFLNIPAGVADNYATLTRGWFVPPTTANYVFFVSSDDPSHLYISTDSDPANKKLVAQESNWANEREWLSSAGGSPVANKRSDQFGGTQWPGGATITLVGGQPYYVEYTQAEGGGGDNGAATFKLASEPDPGNGTASRFTGSAIFTHADVSQLAPILSIDTPGPIVFNKGDDVTLTVSAAGKQPITYQWFKNKLPIAGATSASLVLTDADWDDVGDYALRADNEVGRTWTAGSSDPEKPGAGDDGLRVIMSNPFLVEFEDFNFNGGQHEAVSDTMPYLGNAYAGLAHKGTLDVDFGNDQDDSGGAAFAYNRFVAADPAVLEMKGPGDAVDSALGRLRGNFSVTANYATGWTASGDWQNYTRVFPKGKYGVILGAAHDGVADVDGGTQAPEINIVLSKVANPTIADGSSPGVEGGAQGLTKLGTFTGNGTGAWSSNDLVPLRNDAGEPVLIDLDGTTTVRATFSNTDGDGDFMLFYCTDCVTQPEIEITSITRSGNQITVTWTGGGTLFKASALPAAPGDWTTTGESDGSATLTIEGNMLFLRVQN